MVKPRTILDRQRRIISRHWTFPHRGVGRPEIDPEVVELICRLARDNQSWGYMKIAGELRKLSIFISDVSVRRFVVRHGLLPAPRRSGPSWAEFLCTQAASIIATDFFTVDSVFGQRFYVLFVIELKSRVVRVLGITAHPTGQWVTQMARHLVFDLAQAEAIFKFLIRDGDAKFTGPFDKVFSSGGDQSHQDPGSSTKGQRLC